MLENIPRQLSSRMTSTCSQTGNLMRSTRRKAAPTSIKLPDRQFLLSPEKRTWRSCFRESITSKGSRDSGFLLSDHDDLLSPCDSGFFSSSRTSKNGSVSSTSPWAWPFETKTGIPPVRTFSVDSRSAAGDGSKSACQLSSRSCTTSKSRIPVRSPLGKPTNGRDLLAIEEAVAKLCARVQTSVKLIEAAGGSKSRSRSRASSMRTSSSGTASTNSSLTSLNSIPKRNRAEEEEDEFPDQRDRKGKKLRDQSPEKASVPTRLFACPFAKEDPSRYSHQNMTELDYRHCSIGYWPTIARLKQHLYRTHDRSQLCCHRCWQSFNNTMAHQRHVEQQRCEIRPMPQEKMDLSKYSLVKERSHGDPIILWYKIFEILFPDSERPYSPFAELVIGADLRSLFQDIRERLPALLTASVTERIRNSDQRHTDTQELLDTLVQDCLPEVIQTLRRDIGEARGMDHVLAIISQPQQSSLTQDDTEMVDTEAQATADVPIRPRPTSMLRRLPTVQSIHSESTVTPTGIQAIPDMSLRLFGAPQTSDPFSFDPSDGLSQGLHEMDTGQHAWNWQDQVALVHPENAAIPIDMQLHYPRFAEPERMEYPFPRSDPSSSASSLYHANGSMLTSFDDLSIFTDSHQDEFDYLHQHELEHDGENTDRPGPAVQAIGAEQRTGVAEFNSYSDITGMQRFF